METIDQNWSSPEGRKQQHEADQRVLDKMKAVTLINPKGEYKDLTNIEFFELQTKFALSSVCIKWSRDKKIALWISGGVKGKETVLSISAVNKFLLESGYQIINNLNRS